MLLEETIQHIVPMPLQFTILEYVRSIKITTDSNCHSWTVQIKLISKRCISPANTKWSATETSVSRAIRNNTGNLSLNGYPRNHTKTLFKFHPPTFKLMKPTNLSHPALMYFQIHTPYIPVTPIWTPIPQHTAKFFIKYRDQRRVRIGKQVLTRYNGYHR